MGNFFNFRFDFVYSHYQKFNKKVEDEIFAIKENLINLKKSW